jgi:hypothetical protein
MRKLLLIICLSLASPSFGAMDFDGTNDYVVIPYNASLYVTKMTVSFWAKSDITNYTVSNVYAVGMYEYATNDRVWGVFINMAGDYWCVITSPDGSAPSLECTSRVVTNEWDHIAVTTNDNGGTWTFYYNGISIAVLSGPPPYTDQSSDISIGGLYGANPFNGKIDDVRIYNRVLSANEIKSLAESRSRLDITEGLVGWWPMDEGEIGSVGSGTGKVLDRSGNINHGTATSGPIYFGSPLNYQ